MEYSVTLALTEPIWLLVDASEASLCQMAKLVSLLLLSVHVSVTLSSPVRSTVMSEGAFTVDVLLSELSVEVEVELSLSLVEQPKIMDKIAAKAKVFFIENLF